MNRFACIFVFCVVSAFCGETTSHELILGVRSINEIELNESSVYLIIDGKGEQPGVASVMDDRTTYSVSTNEKGKKIIGYLDMAIPDEAELQVELDCPRHAMSQGRQALETAPTDLVRGIMQQAGSNLRIRYYLTARNDLDNFPVQNRHVYFMLIDM